MSLRAVLSAVCLVVVLAGCGEEPQTAPPGPAEVSADATGHYCGMLLVDHAGPKGQIHLASRSTPVWFSSVRDTIAFTRLPEEPRDIAAIYVNDMGRATSWDQPEAGTWVDARQAYFVIGSSRAGGMGAAEAVPFSEPDAAEAFRAQHGGRVVRLDEIADSYVLGTEELPHPQAADAPHQHPDHTGQ